MCPANSPPPSELGLYWNDKQIIGFLDEYIEGSPLPVDVLDQCSPYDCLPSNLPAGNIWYLVYSNVKKESDNGFWKATGEACEIYSNSMISGWRTTLEYFEGRGPKGQRTDWVMQEYAVTQKQLLGQDKTKDTRLLCRVFLSNGQSSKSNWNAATEFQNNSKSSIKPTASNISGQKSNVNLECGVGATTEVDNKILNSCPRTLSEATISSDGYIELDDLDSHSSLLSSSCPSNLSDDYFDPSALPSEMEAGNIECSQKQASPVPVRPNLESEVRAVADVDENIFNYCPQTLPEHEAIISGNYLELNDLTNPPADTSSSQEQETIISGNYLELNDMKNPQSHSSLQSSSCTRKSLDDYFDSSVLPREIVAEKIDLLQSKPSSSRYNFTPPVRSNDTVLQSSSSGDARIIEFAEGFRAGSTIPKVSTEKGVQEQTTEQHNPDGRTEAHRNTAPSGQKKPSLRGMKKLKMCFCFAHF